MITNQLVTFLGFSSSVGMYWWHLWQHIFKITTWLFTWYKAWKTWNQLGYLLLYVQLGSTLNILIFQVLKWIKFAFTLTTELYILRCLCVQRSTTQIQNYHISFLTILFTNFHPFHKPIQPSTIPCDMAKYFVNVEKYLMMWWNILPCVKEYIKNILPMWHEIFSKYSPRSQALIFTHSC